MDITDFIRAAHGGHVRMTTSDGQSFTGRFRTDILSPNALSAYFFGDQRDLSLAIGDIVSIEPLRQAQIAS